MQPIKLIKFKRSQLVEEPMACNLERFSFSAYTRKVPKGITLSDYSPTEKKMEVEDTVTGDRYWFNIDMFFGTLIPNAEVIMLIDDKGEEIDELNIVEITQFKVKRTWYWKLIFERNLPF